MENKRGVELYYTPPSDEVFEEVKRAAIGIWLTYDNTYGYAEEKIKRIKDLPNVRDNLMYIVAMFDSYNQARLADRLSDEARGEIRERMKAGGTPPTQIPF